MKLNLSGVTHEKKWPGIASGPFVYLSFCLRGLPPLSYAQAITYGGKDVVMKDALQEIAHQLTRLADQGEQMGMQISRGDALEAWGMRIYEAEFLTALERLGIEVVD